MELHVWRPGEREHVCKVQFLFSSVNEIVLRAPFLKQVVRIACENRRFGSVIDDQPVLVDVIHEDGVRQRGYLRRFRGVFDVVVIE